MHATRKGLQMGLSSIDFSASSYESAVVPDVVHRAHPANPCILQLTGIHNTPLTKCSVRLQLHAVEHVQRS